MSYLREEIHWGAGLRYKPDLKVVTNEKQGGSGRWEMIGIGIGPCDRCPTITYKIVVHAPAEREDTHCTENPIYVFPLPRNGNETGLVPNSYIHVSEGDLYIPRIGLPILLQLAADSPYPRYKTTKLLSSTEKE
jgi:hypothetical protein